RASTDGSARRASSSAAARSVSMRVWKFSRMVHPSREGGERIPLAQCGGRFEEQSSGISGQSHAQMRAVGDARDAARARESEREAQKQARGILVGPPDAGPFDREGVV